MLNEASYITKGKFISNITYQAEMVRYIIWDVETSLATFYYNFSHPYLPKECDRKLFLLIIY